MHETHQLFVENASKWSTLKRNRTKIFLIAMWKLYLADIMQLRTKLKIKIFQGICKSFSCFVPTAHLLIMKRLFLYIKMRKLLPFLLLMYIQICHSLGIEQKIRLTKVTIWNVNDLDKTYVAKENTSWRKNTFQEQQFLQKGHEAIKIV